MSALGETAQYCIGQVGKEIQRLLNEMQKSSIALTLQKVGLILPASDESLLACAR